MIECHYDGNEISKKFFFCTDNIFIKTFPWAFKNFHEILYITSISSRLDPSNERIKKLIHILCRYMSRTISFISSSTRVTKRNVVRSRPGIRRTQVGWHSGAGSTKRVVAKAEAASLRPGLINTEGLKADAAVSWKGVLKHR